MKSFRFVAVLASIVGGTLSLVAASDDAVKVKASRALSLAIVDLDKNNAASEQLHDAFKEGLAFEMSQRVKSPTPIKPAKVDAPRAGWGLGTGLYDVAVVVGGNVPKTMISASFTIFKAMPESGEAKHTICLVTRNDDPGLAKLLAESFPDAIKNQFFLKALMKYSGSDDAKEVGLKVAGIGN